SGHEASIDKGDQDRGQAGEKGSDEREKRAEEGQQHERHHQRHTHYDQGEADQQGVHETDQGYAAYIAGEGGEYPRAHLVEALSSPLSDQADEPIPHLPPVLQEEEGQEHRDDQPRNYLGEDDGPALHALGQGTAVLAQAVESLVHPGLDLSLAEVERRLGQLVTDLLHAV